MQFRKSGHKIQLVAYRGFKSLEAHGADGKPVKATKSIVRVIGAIDPRKDFSLEMYDELDAAGNKTGNKYEMRDNEKAQVEAHISYLKNLKEVEGETKPLQQALHFLQESKTSIDAGRSFSNYVQNYDADALWYSIAALEKALISAGHPRPKRAYKKPPKPAVDPRQITIEE